MDFSSRLAEAVPELFGEERHQRVEQTQGSFEGSQDVLPGSADLLELDVPVAEIVVDEVPDDLRGFVIAERSDGVVHLARALIQAAKIQRSSSGMLPGSASLDAVAHVQEDEAGRVPDLVGEGAGGVDAVDGEYDVGAGRGAGEERHADGVGAVLFGHDERVDYVALRLRHLLLLGVAHEAVNVDLAEGHVAHEFDAEHRHARDPEEEDVEAGDEERGRVEVFEVVGLVRPAEG